MIAYTMVGTNDLSRSAAFYDAIFEPLGYKRLVDAPDRAAWGTDFDAPLFFVIKPHDGAAATAGNGTMIAIRVKTSAQVDAIHDAALKLGAVDEGAAGPRGKFYCGYFRDPDGNKLNLFLQP